jgi:hypothetical protein
MSDVTIYHPGTGLRETVPEEALSHLRVSGWRLLSEHEADEAARAEREAAASKTAKKGDA